MSGEAIRRRFLSGIGQQRGASLRGRLALANST